MIIIALLILCASAQNSMTYGLPQIETMQYNQPTNDQSTYRDNYDMSSTWKSN